MKLGSRGTLRLRLLVSALGAGWLGLMFMQVTWAASMHRLDLPSSEPPGVIIRPPPIPSPSESPGPASGNVCRNLTRQQARNDPLCHRSRSK